MLLDGKELSNKIKQELYSKVRHSLVKPCLAVIQIGDDEASSVYVKSKEKACNDVGIYFKHIKFSEITHEREIVNKIIELNNDEYVNGILIQLPIPEKFDKNKLINLINKDKDVDGLTDINAGKLFKFRKNIVPCTPLGIMRLLEEYDIPVEGKHAVIVGKSDLVGKPLAMLLLEKGATVTVCHSKTNDLGSITKQADILVSAVGKKDLITKDMVKNDSVVIDVGIHRNEQNKLCGDVDFESVEPLASAITPVPGGVGPMTIAMLMKNCVESVEQ